MCRLEQTTAGMQRVALGLWECAAGGRNRPSRTYSRAPGWHGPNGCAGCTGDTLALHGRHAGAGAEPDGSAAALAARRAVGTTAAGWAGELCQDQDQAEGDRCSAAAAAAAAGEAEEEEEDVAAAAAGQAAAVAAGGIEGGVAIGSSKRAVADEDHQAAVERRVDAI